MPLHVTVQNAAEFLEAPTQEHFELWANAVLTGSQLATDVDTEVTIRIVDQQESAELNEAFRKKTGPTNILSFPYEPIPGETDHLLGDIAICAPLVVQQAQEQQKPPINHWAHLTIHGILHLLGYDHIKDSDATVMENLEITILQQLGYPNPYEP